MAEAAAQFVQQQIKALNRILNSLQNAEEDLTKGQNLTKAEVQCLVQLTGEQAVAGLRKQVAAWEAILAGEQPEAVAPRSVASTPPLSDETRRSKARFRLQQRGAAQTLGGVLNMSEEALLSHRKALNSTSSPAAAEMAQLRGGGSAPLASLS